MNNKKSNKGIEAKHISGSNWKWKLWLPQEEADSVDIQEFKLVNQKQDKTCLCPVHYVEPHENTGIIVEADISPLKEMVENCRYEKWRVFFKGQRLTVTGFCKEERDKKKKNDIYGCRLEFFEEPIGHMPFADRTVEATPYCSKYGGWMISIGDSYIRYIQAIKCVGVDNGFTGEKPFFTVRCPSIEGINWIGVVLTYRFRVEDERRDYFFNVSKVTKEGNSLLTYTELDISGLEFFPINWDVRMVFEKNGEEFWCHVTDPYSIDKKNRDKAQRGELRRVFSKQSIMLDDELQMSITGTDYGNISVIVQQRIPYSGLRFRLKERLALLINKLLRSYLKKKNILLVYEKFCSMAQDNGFYFFKYCMDNEIERKTNHHIYYVIDKSQRDYSNVKEFDDHVIQLMSLKHMVYVLAAKLLISSDSRRHAYAWRATESVIRKKVINDKKSVFLQHGVFGLKRSDEFVRGSGGETNLFIASNEQEKEFILDDMGYKPEEVAITGLARWDVLQDKSSKVSQKRILVMPTWRKWLEETTDEIFVESEYYLKYMELINSKELSAILQEQDLWMDFYIHPKFSEMIKNFSTTTERIRLVPFGSEPLNELIMESVLLITDYSSVCWDVYYQGKPVIFYQFDLDKYNEVQGAYMDLENDLFGDRAETLDDLLKLLEESAEEEFNLKPKYAKMRDGMFKYIDHNNSKRICEEIMKRGW